MLLATHFVHRYHTDNTQQHTSVPQLCEPIMMPDRLAAHFLAVCLFLFLHRFVAGGCSEYGHSCWGGHGKRSSEGSSDWYLSKLLMAQRPVLDQRNIFGPENIVRGPISNSDSIVDRVVD